MPFCHMTLKSKKPIPKAYPRKLETLGDHLRKRRLDLGLTQREVAGIIGVNETTIVNWEKNHTSPPVKYLPKIVEFLGYIPFDGGRSLGERIANCRKLLGLNQKELANLLGVDPYTVSCWEKDERKPLKRHMEKLREIFSGLPWGEL